MKANISKILFQLKNIQINKNILQWYVNTEFAKSGAFYCVLKIILTNS